MKDLLEKIKKNYSIFFFIATIVAFLIIPITFTQKYVIEEQPVKIEIKTEETNQEEIDYGVKYKTINLLHTSDNTVENIELEEYIVNVVAAEMPVDYEMEALKAQSTVARTYTLYQMSNSKKHENADICDNSACCQAWISKEKRFERWTENQEENWNKLREAVYSTAGDVIMYEGKPIDAFFHSNSGGKTEIPVNVWGGTNFPYLQVVETSGEDNYSQFSSSKEYTKEELENKMKEKYNDFEINWNEENCISILEYNESSRIKTIKIGNKNISGVEARTIFELRSSNFKVTIEGEKVKFDVVGYGHGVGLSQTGSNTLAKEGKSYQEIINHYYKNIEIKNIKN